MKWEWVLITPEMAKSILEKSKKVEEELGFPPNRRYEVKRATEYAKQIMRGDFQNENGEDIQISKAGRVLNGQHRLGAIIITGKPMEYGIKSDIDDSMTIYDRGRNRSTSDTLTMTGLPKEIVSKTFVSIVRLHYHYIHGNMYVSDFEVERFIKKHEETFTQIHRLLSGRTSTRKGTRVNLKNTIILIGIMYALEAGVNFDVIDSFCEVLYTGIPKSLNQQAALVLRNDILSGAFKSTGGCGRKEKIPMVEKAIYDFVSGYQRKVTYKNTTERIYSNLFKEEN